MFDHQILGLADQIMATRDIGSFLHLKFSWLKHIFKRQDFFSLKKVGELLGRGVRSDAQLSGTETRFQKCSQSGKNGSEHPMLSISMAYNMISCKKVERNTQKLKIADFTM